MRCPCSGTRTLEIVLLFYYDLPLLRIIKTGFKQQIVDGINPLWTTFNTNVYFEISNFVLPQSKEIK